MALIVSTFIILISAAGGLMLLQEQHLLLWQHYELVILTGSLLVALVIATPDRFVKNIFGFLTGFRHGTRYHTQASRELLALLHKLLEKSRKHGIEAIAGDIADPYNSSIFARFPRVLNNPGIVRFLTDYLHIIAEGTTNPFELENLMDSEMEVRHQSKHAPIETLSRMTAGLSGIAIIAAIPGVVITMGMLSGHPVAIGLQAGIAAIAALLGILITYGFLGPVSQLLVSKNSVDMQLYACLKVSLIASVNGYNPQQAVEFGRRQLVESGQRGIDDTGTGLHPVRRSSS